MIELINESDDQDLGAQFEKEIKRGGRGKDSLFRVTLRNQIHQIAIADNKAHMIISINTIIISLIVAGLGSGMSFTDFNIIRFPQIIAPLTILMLSCTVSAIFSILAARPRMIKNNISSESPFKSNLFFGNFRDTPLPNFVNEMFDVIKSPKRIYTSMIIDIYFNGQVLSRKYKLLAWSYSSFLIGLVTCVGLYLVLSLLA